MKILLLFMFENAIITFNGVYILESKLHDSRMISMIFSLLLQMLQNKNVTVLKYMYFISQDHNYM